MKKALYNRKLKCGHERMTSIAFICGNYKKPIIGESCYCRECMEEAEIIDVIKLSDEEMYGEEKENEELFGSPNLKTTEVEE